MSKIESEEDQEKALARALTKQAPRDNPLNTIKSNRQAQLQACAVRQYAEMKQIKEKHQQEDSKTVADLLKNVNSPKDPGLED